MSSHNSASNNIYKMDVLRGLAIIYVFSIHALQHYTGNEIEVNQGSQWLLDFSNQPWHLILFTITPISYGWSGVQLFFIISGFLIHYSFLRKGQSNLNKKEFFIRRFFRIYPPYLVVLLFIAIGSNRAVFHNGQSLYDFVSHLLMTYNFDKNTFFSFNGAFWSLAVELQLYLLYPLYLILRKNIKVKNTLFILLGIYVFFTIAKHFVSHPQLVFLAETNVLKVWIIWGLGAWLGENYFNGKQTLPVKNGYWVLFLFFFISLQKAFPFTANFNDLIWGIFYIVFANFYLFHKRNTPKAWEKGLIKIGESSYSLYLTHQPIIIAIAGSVSVLGLSKRNAEFYFLDALVVFGVAYAFSVGLYYLLEKPSISLGRKLISYLREKNK